MLMLAEMFGNFMSDIAGKKFYSQFRGVLGKVIVCLYWPSVCVGLSRSFQSSSL